MGGYVHRRRIHSPTVFVEDKGSGDSEGFGIALLGHPVHTLWANSVLGLQYIFPFETLAAGLPGSTCIVASCNDLKAGNQEATAQPQRRRSVRQHRCSSAALHGSCHPQVAGDDQLSSPKQLPCWRG